MSNGIFVWVQERKGGEPLISLLHPLNHPQAQVAFDLKKLTQDLIDAMQSGLPESGLIKRIGLSLTEALEQHPAVQAELKSLLGTGGPIYLRVDPPSVEGYPWEALHDAAHGFFSIDQRTPVARVKTSRVTRGPDPSFVPPLRLFAVLGPTRPNVDATPEWQALYRAVKDSKLNMRLQVLVADPDLKTAIEALPEGQPGGWIECELLTTQKELFEKIAIFQPHLLHFFCHGVAASPPFLQAGNKRDFLLEETGSITVEANQLRQRADPDQNVWLVTLDCCESAGAASENDARSRAFASSLVSEGFPAVIGMREKVADTVAYNFCELFYRQALADVRGAFAAAATTKKPAEIRWENALFSARQQICADFDGTKTTSEVAESYKDWTIPILLRRPEPFFVRVDSDPANPLIRPKAQQPAPTPAGPELKALEQLVLLRASLTGVASDSVLAEVDARIQALKEKLGV